MWGSPGSGFRSTTAAGRWRQSANDFTNWTATNLPVIFGNNIVQAFAVDAAGNVSLTNAVKFLGFWRHRHWRAMRRH